VATGERSDLSSDDGREQRAERSAIHDARDAVGGAISTAGVLRRPLEPHGAVDDRSFLSAVDAIEFDSIEEVDAAARSIRRVAIEYGSFFLVVLLSVPVLSMVAPGWSRRPVWAGLTLGFLTLAVGLHVFFVALVVAGARAADRIEDDMLGRPEDDYRHLHTEPSDELGRLQADG
jgi:hypothetical protein